MTEEPDVVCFLRKHGSEKFLGPGRRYGKEAVELIRKGYDVVGISRTGWEFTSESSWLKSIMNLEEMENDVYFCSEGQYKARKKFK